MYATAKFRYNQSMKKRAKRAFALLKQDIKTILPGLLGVILYYLLVSKLFKASCPMLLITGLPCPGCGMTRCAYLLATFQWQKAFYLNPSCFFWLAYVLWFLISRYILQKKYKITQWFLYLVLIATIAIYLRGMILYFPNRIPYVHRSKNLISLLLQFLK